MIRLYNPEDFKRVEVTEKEVPKYLKTGLVPSVTEILSICNEGEYLLKWHLTQSIDHYIKNGNKKAAIEWRNRESADYGTICHELCEEHLTGVKFEGEYGESHLETVAPFKRWADLYVDKTIFTEKFFADSTLKYGGTADMLLLMKNGETVLADLKFKKNSQWFAMKPSLNYKCQLSAYRNHFSKEFGGMKTANFLLASPFGDPTPCMKVFEYGYKDYTETFECMKHLWWAKYS